MKIEILETEWSGWDGSSKKTKYTYEAKRGTKVIVKSRTTSTIVKGGFMCKKNIELFSEEIWFAFKILKVKDGFVKIKVWGEACFDRTPDNRYVPIKPFVLKLGETREFTSHTFDWGLIFDMTLIKE